MAANITRRRHQAAAEQRHRPAAGRSKTGGHAMCIAPTVDQALKSREIEHDILKHPRAPSSARVAEAAHVAGRRVAKAVVLKDEQGYVLAVLPATHRVLTAVLNSMLHRQLKVAPERDVVKIFSDCERGAVP